MGDLVKGVAPGFLLMPAREYEWERGERVELRVPLEGKFSDFVEPGALAAGQSAGATCRRRLAWP